MIGISDLQTSLLDLLFEIRNADIQLIIGGGFGIYLKTNHVRKLDQPSLFQEWPEPRSTNDLDLYLRPELLIESVKLKPLSEALGKLGYTAVPGAKNYQFVKPGPAGIEAGSIKIDILTGPQDSFQNTRVKVDFRRARPNPSVGIHAHPVDEAPTLEIGLLPVLLTGKLSSDESYQNQVFLPHPYTFLMMKLFAFRDRLDDPNKEYGRYHALDLYTILATTMENEWNSGIEIRDWYARHSFVVEAGKLVSKYFVALDRLGMIRLRESPYYRNGLQLDDFMSTLQELFPMKTRG